MPLQALPHLRFLEIVFPPYDYDFLAPNESAYEDWIEFIGFLSDILSQSQLTLRLYFADYDSTGYNRTNFRVNMTPTKYENIVKAYERTLRPLKRLQRAFRCLFIHLANPWSWASEELPDIYLIRQRSRVQIEAMELRIERFIMANDNYDSVTCGKNEEKKSHWLISAECANEYGMPVYSFNSSLDAWI